MKLSTGHSIFITLASFMVVIIMIILFSFQGYFLLSSGFFMVFCGGILFAYAGIEKIYPLLLFSLPFSLVVTVFGDATIMFPSELLASAIAFAVIIEWFRNPSDLITHLKNPVSVFLVMYLLSLLVSVFFSEMLMVSLKSVLIKIIYFLAFYGGAIIFISRKIKREFVLVSYLLPFFFIVILVLVRHSYYGFSKDVAGYITKPFFQDHTIYATVIAFFIPLIVAWFINTRRTARIFFGICILFFVAALFFATSRAAWLSISVAFILALLIKLKTPGYFFALILIFVVSFISINSEDILIQLKSNRFDSNSKNADLAEQTKSVGNITNDQSNSERINRWKCAWRMFCEKPFSGFGPGTYQFTYLSFQRENEMTRISVKTPFNIQEGRGGTAHNEYLLILSESGIGAALFFILAIVFTFAKGIKIIYLNKKNSLINTAMLLALTTYIIHSLFNNFLDTDKTAFLFFFSTAWFVAEDIRLHKLIVDEN